MTAALILGTPHSAAGNDSKERADMFDPTKNVGGMSAIKRQIETFRQAGIEQIAIVLGNDEDKIESHCARHCVAFVRYNKTDVRDDGLRAGLEYLKGRCSEVFVAPSNYPLFTAETVQKMLECETAVAYPEIEERQGYPVLLSGRIFDGILSNGSIGDPLELLCAQGADSSAVPVRDAGVLLNAETAEASEIDAAARLHPLRRLKPEVKVSLSREHSFFGPGTLHLLYLTGEAESLMQASKLMGLSYSKARKIMARMETYLGYRVIESQHGGRAGGYSMLTPQARVLMEKYKALQEEIQENAQEIFDKYFDDDMEMPE